MYNPEGIYPAANCVPPPARNRRCTIFCIMLYMKKPSKAPDFLFAFGMLALMVLLYIVCVKGFPFWLVSTVLAINVIYLIIMVLVGPSDGYDFSMRHEEEYKKNHKKLLLWGISAGIVFVALILISIFYETVWPLIVLYILFELLKPHREKRF